jgi:hypothetical protein
MTSVRIPRRAASVGLARAARLACAAGLLLPLLAPAQARANGWGWYPGYRPVQQPQVIYDYPPGQVFAGQPVYRSAEDQARRCNQGRLVGGLMGVGAGYALSRGDARVWATPIGALLGSQMGCNAAQGRAPLPW